MKFLKMLFTLIFTMMLYTTSVYAIAPKGVSVHPLGQYVVILCFAISLFSFIWCMYNVVKICLTKQKKMLITILNVVWALANIFVLIKFFTTYNFEEFVNITVYVMPINFLIMLINSVLKIVKKDTSKKEKIVGFVILIFTIILAFCYIDPISFAMFDVSVIPACWKPSPTLSEIMGSGIK